MNYRETRGWIQATGLEHTSYWISVKYMYIASTMQQQPSLATTWLLMAICTSANKPPLKVTSPKHPHFCPPFLLEEGLMMEPFHMTSRPPYCCPKGNHACWFPKPILWELTLFSSKNFLFFKEMFYSCWLYEWQGSTTKLHNLYKVAPTKW